MKYYILFILIFFAACIPGPKDLGGGYVLAYNNNILDRIILINSPGGGITLTYYEGTKKIERYFKNEDWIVDSYVANATFDDKFILIDQKPIDSICECNQKCLELKYPNYNNMTTYKMCEDAIKKAKIHLFYIIDKPHNILYGPMSKNELNNEIIQLQINEIIQLQIKVLMRVL